MLGGGVLANGVFLFSDVGWLGSTFRTGMRRPTGNAEIGRKPPLTAKLLVLPMESVDGRGPSLTLGLWSSALLKSPVLGRADCDDILPFIPDMLDLASKSYIDGGFV